MITKKRVLFATSLLLGLCSFSVTTFEPDADAGGTEVMTDRCSGEVAFSPGYMSPASHGTLVLKRQHDGYSPETTLTVKPNDSGFVRWWCHSTEGNVFDPGTWRISSNTTAFEGCLLSVVQPIVSDKVNVGQCARSIKVSSSAFDGWTPEESRCKNHTGHLRVRLGPDRLLTTECL
ncbi:MAG: hypothetical protein ABI183_06530 [Polyangiaceae bacterium]